MSARTFLKLEGDKGYALITEGIRLEFRHLRREHHQLHAELAVECEWAGAQCFEGTRIIDCADLNLSSHTTRSSRAKFCADRSRTRPQDFDWPGLIHHACVLVIEAERTGEPAVALATVGEAETDDDHIVNGFAVPRRDIATLVADGGKGKSTFAMYFTGEIEQRGERILECDYETNQHVARRTALRMFGTVPAGMFYRPCKQPFVDEVDAIRRDIDRLGITYGILDSIVPACGDPAEDSVTASAVLRAQRATGIGWLNIAHVSKAAERGKEKPFGSQFWWNWSRSVWVLESHATPERLMLAVHNRKRNTGPPLPAVGFELHYGAERIDVKPCNVLNVGQLAEGLPLDQRVKEIVRPGPLPLLEIAERIGEKPNTVAQMVRRHNLLFTRELGMDGVRRIGLVAKEPHP